jgi:hypothetical protein
LPMRPTSDASVGGQHFEEGAPLSVDGGTGRVTAACRHRIHLACGRAHRRAGLGRRRVEDAVLDCGVSADARAALHRKPRGWASSADRPADRGRRWTS